MKTQNNRCSPGTGHSSVSREGLTQLFSEWSKAIRYYSIFAAAGTLMTGGAQDLPAQDVVANEQMVPRETGTPTRRRALKPEFSRSGDRRLPFTPGPLLSPLAMTGSDNCPGTPIPAGSYTAASPYVDTGDTTGTNDTVTTVIPYYSYNSNGPDRIYSFVVTSIGANPEITVTTTSPTYRPMIYVSDRCPAGTGATISDWDGNHHFYSTKVFDSRWGTGNTAVIGDWAWNYSDTLYFGKRLYLYIDSAVAGEGGAYTVTMTDMRISSTPSVERHARPDFDGDGLSDFAVFRPGNSTWYIRGSAQGVSSVQWGLPTDKLVPEDYDGDGKTDVAVFRDGVWHILGSSQGYISVQWGVAGDVPVPADYTGDGHSEIAIFRDGVWWMYDLTTGTSDAAHWGLAGDKPVPMDYDADGKIDLAVVRNGTWYLYRSHLGPASVLWGVGSDKIVPGYYGPHNQADFSVYRNGAWFTLLPPFYFDVDGYVSMQWGLPTDVPVLGNFFSVWSADAGVFRDGSWWMRECVGCSGHYVVQWGQAGDIPISAAYNR